MRSKRVKIEFTSDAALVLYDWLTRFNQRTETHLVDQAEERVLFDLEALLEKALVAPLQSDYAALLAQAGSRAGRVCLTAVDTPPWLHPHSGGGPSDTQRQLPSYRGRYHRRLRHSSVSIVAQMRSRSSTTDIIGRL